jgi:hypothetical protein
MVSFEWVRPDLRVALCRAGVKDARGVRCHPGGPISVGP